MASPNKHTTSHQHHKPAAHRPTHSAPKHEPKAEVEAKSEQAEVKTEQPEQVESARPILREKEPPAPTPIASGKRKVKMRFTEHKFYNDLKKPIFLAGEIYELEGEEWIARWLKRGGEIVEGKVTSKPATKEETVQAPPAEAKEEADEEELDL